MHFNRIYNQLKSNTHKAHEHDSETCSCHTCNDSEDYNGAHHNNHSHHDHDGHHHEHQPFVSYTFHNLQSLDHTQWIDFCNKLPSTVLRVKGIVPTASGPMELQYTLQSCSHNRYALKGLPPSCYWHRYRHSIHKGESV